MSGFRRRALWARYGLAGNAVEVRDGRRRFWPTARPLDTEQAYALLTACPRRNRPIVSIRRTLPSRLAGVDHDPSEASGRRGVARLQLIALRPSV